MGSWSNTLSAISANYTVQSSDDGDTFILDAAASFALTYGAPGGYDANHVNRIVNPYSSIRGVLVALSGGVSTYLYPGQSGFVDNSSGAWQLVDLKPWRPASTAVLNVDPTSGNDASDGLGTGSGAFAHVQAALALAYATNGPCTIVVLNPVTEQVSVEGRVGIWGNGENFDLTITGTPSNPFATPWTIPTGNSGSCLSALFGGCVTLNGFAFSIPKGSVYNNAALLSSTNLSVIDVANCAFGDRLGGAAMCALDGGRFNIIGDITVAGRTKYFYYVLRHGGISVASPHTIVGPAYSGNFFRIDGPGIINASGISFAGDVLGLSGGNQYSVNDKGVLLLGYPTQFPPNLSTGTTSLGGIVPTLPIGALVPTLPSPVGLGIAITRTEELSNQRQANISGKEVVVGYWSNPRLSWEISFNVLRSAAAFAEWQEIVGFFANRLGGNLPFFYQDPDDCQVTDQVIGTGDGVTTTFTAQRTLGDGTETILAPNFATAGPTGIVPAVYVDGQSVSFSFTPWSLSGAGSITLASAPASGQLVTADFSYAFPCRFDDDKMPIDRMFWQIYAIKKLSFHTIK